MALNVPRRFGAPLILAVILSGCATLPGEHVAPAASQRPVAQTAPKGLSAITALIRSGELARADEAYAAYRNTHETDRGVPPMIVTLARAHLEAGEYLLTRFYLNEYRRDYPSGKERAQIEYLAGEVRYRQYWAGHDDALAQEAYRILQTVSRTFRHTPWAAKARTLSAKLRDEQNRYYEKLAKYYEDRGKPKAAAIYRGKIKK